ncbi:MAG TPA: ABC transporter ATP-binding protein [Egibacteraceae bacterium]|nr:ABC transporter ATP-binding protein [Egibacteraceae bacterium]
MAPEPGDELLRVEDLRVHFPAGGRALGKGRDVVRAVDGVSLSVRRGETLGLVGESGSGKTTTGLALLRLVEPTSGRVWFDGTDVTALRRRDLRAFRRRVGMVFQDPFASLNPRRSVGASVAEPMEIHGLHREGRDRRVAELFEMVGLDPALRRRYPHEFSGGQRQRIGIARALAAEPDFLVLDEPIASLDVSIQAQVVNLLRSLQRELGLTYLFIAHDLAAVQHISDRIAVLYLGVVMESGARDAVVGEPQHPYTRSLVSAVPIPDPERERRRERIVLVGDVPSPLDPPSGCNFRTRCPDVFAPCGTVEPLLQDTPNGNLAACHLHGVVGREVPRSHHPDSTQVAEAEGRVG